MSEGMLLKHFSLWDTRWAYPKDMFPSLSNPRQVMSLNRPGIDGE